MPREPSHTPQLLNSSFPISNMKDVTIHFDVKKLFCEPYCSQAHHCVRTAYDHPVQLLAVNFNLRILATICSAQGVSNSNTGLVSVLKHHFDDCIARNNCIYFMEDNADRIKSSDEVIRFLRFFETSGFEVFSI